MAILDLYTNSKGDYKNAGGKTPNVTDVIHNTKFGPEAVDGFTANEALGDPTKFNMIDNAKSNTKKDFDKLNLNTGTTYNGTVVSPYNGNKQYNDGKLTGK
jgi:hypothetical protein